MLSIDDNIKPFWPGPFIIDYRTKKNTHLVYETVKQYSSQIGQSVFTHLKEQRKSHVYRTEIEKWAIHFHINVSNNLWSCWQMNCPLDV